MLTKLAYGFSDTDASRTDLSSFSAAIQTKLVVFVKKQLSSTGIESQRIEFQRMALVGAVALINVLSDSYLVGIGKLHLSNGAANADSQWPCNGPLTADERVVLWGFFGFENCLF